MMTKNRIAAALLAAGMIAAPAMMVAQQYGNGYNGNGYSNGYNGNGYNNGYGNGYAQGPGYGPGPQGPGYGRGPGGWDAVPSDFTRDVQRNGFRDGMYGAQKDFENRRRPTVMNRDEYRNYRGPERRVYRQAFERGYNVWWRHNNGMGGPRPY